MLTPLERVKFEKQFAILRQQHSHLTEPAWLYAPYPGRFDTHYCVYCGERARTYDVITSLHHIAVNGHGSIRKYLLVAACHECQHYLGPEFPSNSLNERRHAVLIDLRRRYLHSRGPRTGTPKIILNRRIQSLIRAMASGNKRRLHKYQGSYEQKAKSLVK